MRPILFLALMIGAIGCSSTPPYEPGVRVELAKTDLGVQPPVFRWDAPVAARVTVRRGDTVVWEIAEGDAPGPNEGVQRGPITMPLRYGVSFYGASSPAPRTLIAPQALLPQRVYSVTIIGYDGTVFEGRFSVQDRVEPPPFR